MTEKEVWLRLARLWLSTTDTYRYERSGEDVTVIYIDDRHALGLCASIWLLVTDIQIRKSTMEKIHKYGDNHNKRYGLTKTFYWPLTAEGATQRAEFCRKQAELLP